jgi:hypothetical protein
MEKVLYYALTAIMLIALVYLCYYLKQQTKEMHYGKEHRKIFKKILHGDYQEFKAACYQLINFQKFGLGGCSYHHLREKEKTMIVEVARKKGWLLVFMAETSEDMRKIFIYPQDVKEEEIFSPLF